MRLAQPTRHAVGAVGIVGLWLVAACGADATPGADVQPTDASVTDTASDTGGATDTSDTSAGDAPSETRDDGVDDDGTDGAAGETDTGADDTGVDHGDVGGEDADTAADIGDGAAETDAGPGETDTGADDADTGTPEIVEPPSGESCADPLPVTLPASFTAPVTVSGDTRGLADDHAVDAGACPGLAWAIGQGAPDEAWAFTAPSAGSYRVTLRAAEADLALYVLVGCDAGDAGVCRRGADDIGGGVAAPDVLRVTLAAGETVHVIVDAFSATPAEAGAYQLTFDPPQTAPLGDSCAQAITIQPGPGGFVGSGDNGPASALSDDHDASGCGADFDGAGVADQVWRFVAPTAGRWQVTVTPTGDADEMLYVFGDASCAGACVAHVDDGEDGVPEALALDLAQGEAAWIVVDAWTPEAGGQYLLSISGCEPTCADGACGMDDGCGGTCGCDAAEVCDALAAACVTRRAGESCADPSALVAGTGGALVGTGDLASGRADDHAAGACAADAGLPYDGTGTPDEAWTFEVANSGRYVVTVTSADDADVFFALYASHDCAVDDCLGVADDGLLGEADRAAFDLAADSVYTLVIDTWSPDEAGAYTVSVALAEPPGEGDGCADPYPLTPADDGWSGSGDLSLVDVADPDDFEVGACTDLGDAPFPPDGVDTPDEVFTLTVPSDGDYTLRLGADPTSDVFLQVLAGATCAAATCVGFVDDVIEAGGVEEVTLTLDADTTYWLVVDTFAGVGAGPYVIDVAPVCEATCTPGTCGLDACGEPCACGPGEACADALCVPIEGNACADPYPLVFVGDVASGAGDLAAGGVVDDVLLASCADLGASAPASGAGARDEVFAFTVPADGAYVVEARPGAGLDVQWGLFAGATCATATCLGYLDAGDAGAPESASVTLTAGVPYWLVVEHAGTTTLGPYTVSVAAAPPPGDACADPIPLELGLAASGTTVGATDALDGAACAGGPLGDPGRGEVVYRVTLPLAGAYDLTLTPVGAADLALYALAAAGASCDASQCADGADAAGIGGAEAIEVVAAVDGAVAYVVVDGAGAAGGYTLTSATDVEGCASDLFFSQYIEGSGTNKALEIYNGTGRTIDLSAYSVRVRQNGGSGSGSSGSYQNLTLSGSLASGATFTLCNTGFAALTCDLESGASVVNFNGNDAIMLMTGGVVIDQIGLDDQPTTGPWVVGGGTTLDHTLVREPAVRAGTSDWSVGATTWLAFPQDTLTGFDAHDFFWACTPP